MDVHSEALRRLPPVAVPLALATRPVGVQRRVQPKATWTRTGRPVQHPRRAERRRTGWYGPFDPRRRREAVTEPNVETLHTPVGMSCSCGEPVWSVEHAATGESVVEQLVAVPA